MTLESFGNVVPIHIDMLQLVGYEWAERDMRPTTNLNARKRVMMAGLHDLKQATDVDFGYDASAWREFLIQWGDEFGYTHPYAYESVDAAVRRALLDQNVAAALKEWAESQR